MWRYSPISEVPVEVEYPYLDLFLALDVSCDRPLEHLGNKTEPHVDKNGINITVVLGTFKCYVTNGGWLGAGYTDQCRLPSQGMVQRR